MRIIVTGAGGFVGSALVVRLAGHTVVAVDADAAALPALPHVVPIGGDLADDAVIAQAFAGGCDALVHLATVPGGAAEADPALGKHINIDATMRLIDTAISVGNRPRVVFASSVAVLGEKLPAQVDDAAPLAPTMIYGAHKAMIEQWIATRTRRGDIDGISLRLSGVVARPAGPSGMKSAFLSDVFHAVRAGERFTMPLPPEAQSWLISRPSAAAAFVHAVTADLSAAPSARAVTLPTVAARIGALVAAIAVETGAAAQVDYVVDPGLTKAFGEHPPITTAAAEALGFIGDGTVERLVANAVADLNGTA